MNRRLRLGAVAGAAILLLTSACGTDEEPEPAPTEPSSSAPTQDAEDTEDSAVPAGEGEGGVDLQVDGRSVPGDDWGISCSELDGGLSVVGSARPLSTVTVELDGEGAVRDFVASAEDLGPFSASGADASGLAVEVTGTGLELSGSIDAMIGETVDVAGTLTCPAA